MGLTGEVGGVNFPQPFELTSCTNQPSSTSSVKNKFAAKCVFSFIQ